VLYKSTYTFRILYLDRLLTINRQTFVRDNGDFLYSMKKIQRKKNEMRAAKEMAKKDAALDAANILTNDYDEDVLF